MVSIQFSPDDRFVAAIGESNSLMVWDTTTGAAVCNVRATEHPYLVICWDNNIQQVSSNQMSLPSYTLISATQKQVLVNTLDPLFTGAEVRYQLTQTPCTLPNTGLTRTYTFATIRDDMLYLGTTGGEICLFNIEAKVYRATMPISSNGVHSFAANKDSIYVGSGDGKLKKLLVSDGKWNLTHEAQLDSKIVSICLSHDKKEMLVGTQGAKIYRVIEEDLSFMLHTDAHSSQINDLSFSLKRSDQFLCVDDSGVVKVWDLSVYKSVFTSFIGRQGVGGTSCCIALDDESVVTGWSDGFIRCYNR